MSLLTRRLPLASLQPHAERLAEFLVTKERVFCLGGAGVSTESGIPDYRSPGRPPYKYARSSLSSSSPSSSPSPPGL